MNKILNEINNIKKYIKDLEKENNKENNKLIENQQKILKKLWKMYYEENPHKKNDIDIQYNRQKILLNEIDKENKENDKDINKINDLWRLWHNQRNIINILKNDSFIKY